MNETSDQIAALQPRQFDAFQKNMHRRFFNMLLCYIYDIERAERIYVIVWKRALTQVFVEETPYLFCDHMLGLICDVGRREIKQNPSLHHYRTPNVDVDRLSFPEQVAAQLDIIYHQLPLLHQEVWSLNYRFDCKIPDCARYLSVSEHTLTNICQDIGRRVDTLLTQSKIAMTSDEAIHIHTHHSLNHIEQQPSPFVQNQIRAIFGRCNHDDWTPPSTPFKMPWHYVCSISRFQKISIAVTLLVFVGIFFVLRDDEPHQTVSIRTKILEKKSFPVSHIKKTRHQPLQHLYLRSERLMAQKKYRLISQITRDLLHESQPSEHLYSLLKIRSKSLHKLKRKHHAALTDARISRLFPDKRSSSSRIVND